MKTIGLKLKLSSFLFLFIFFVAQVDAMGNISSDRVIDETILNYTLTVNVFTSDGVSPQGAHLFMEALEPPNEIYEDTVPAGGSLVIEDLSCGNYLLKIMKPGYELYRDSSLYICSDDSLNVILQEGRWPVRDLFVDPLTSLAAWKEPLAGGVLFEDFEGELFPPEGWDSETMSYYGPGWFHTENGSGGDWNVPPGDGYYACVNDAVNCSVGTNSCCDYLITPPLDISAYEDYLLVYDTYFDSKYGGVSTVEYSEDGGNVWTQLYELDASWFWREEIVDLSPWSGMAAPENFILRFHYDDLGYCADGWAVDNIKVAPASSRVFRNEDQLLGYEVYLDSVYVDITTDTIYQYTALVYGQTYEAAVGALYSSGLSEKDRYVFTSEYLIPPGDLTVEAAHDTAMLAWEAPQDSAGIPAHLLGYNIYRDHFDEGADSLAFIDDPQQTTWFEAGLEPMMYAYAVTAVYDLEVYGFPGQTDESAMAGPMDCLITYGHDLPFTENWQEGSFANQQWETSCGAWQINQSSGNGAPSAEFLAPDTLQDYECKLISYPLKGSMYPGGGIFMDFDLKLQNIAATVNEIFEVRIWSRGSWFTLWEKNAWDNFDWKTYRINLSDYACGHDFRIAFVATGVNSSHIESWSLDNINIFHVCPGPYDLTAQTVDSLEISEVLLDWNTADTVAFFEQWLQWDNDTNHIGVGYDGPADFQVAARFEPMHLNELDAKFIKKVSFFPAEENCQYFIRIWQGTDASVLLIEQEVNNPVIDEWNTIEITPVPIDAGEELWIGYRCIAQEGFPAGADAGPAVAGYGDMLLDENQGWISISEEFLMDYNWNIKAYVTVENGKMVEMVSPDPLPKKLLKEGSPKVKRKQRPTPFTNASRIGFEGYYVHRRHNDGQWLQLNEEPLRDTWYIDELNTGGNYCYYVEAVFEACTSAPSDTACISSWVGIEGNETKDLKIWPNPARNIVKLSADHGINKVVLMNGSGQAIREQTFNNSLQAELGMENIEDGLYFIRIETTGGTVIRKITIAR